MIEGTMKNLHQFHISPKNLFVSDIGAVHNIISEEMDAVITDAPYGKSTTTKKEEIQKLYTRAFDSISKVLRTGGHIVIGLPNRTLEPLFHHYFTLDHMIIIPVHRSLTRYFYCGTKKQP
jgi:tRNA (guanine10-N2)-dimethyltransferase